MDFFKKFSKLNYPVSGNDIILTDILTSIRINQRLTTTDVLFFAYEIQDGETPEGVSERFYDTNRLHWLVLFVNGIGNVYTQWPLSSELLFEEAKLKYDNVYAVHHYENSKGHVIDTPEAGSTRFDVITVSNWDYEVAENDKKRSVRLVAPEYAETFALQFQKSLRG